MQLYLLEKFGLIHYVLAFVRDEGRHLGFMAMTLWFIINYKPLEILWVCECTCFGHVMSKVYQYATNDNKASMGLTLVSVKFFEVAL